MAKLGYTWYPKDWGNSESVFELNLAERGLYREIIDLAMLNDNKNELKKDVWCRKFSCSIDELDNILNKLTSLGLIVLKSKSVFVPSCENRLNLVRGGKRGGEKKPNAKPIPKPLLSLEEENYKPIANQIEIESETKNKTETKDNILIDNNIFSKECKVPSEWMDIVAKSVKIKPDSIPLLISNFDDNLIIREEQKKSLKEYKEHFANWLLKQDLSQFSVKQVGKTNQV